MIKILRLCFIGTFVWGKTLKYFSFYVFESKILVFTSFAFNTKVDKGMISECIDHLLSGEVFVANYAKNFIDFSLSGY